jgi:phage terminase small subunit
MVAAAIAEAQTAQSERTEIKADRVLQELARIGFSNMLDYIRIGPNGLPYTDFAALTREQAAAIAELVVETRAGAPASPGSEDAEAVAILRVRFKLADKLSALEKLGRHLGLFKDRPEHDLTDPLQEFFQQICGDAIRPVDNA